MAKIPWTHCFIPGEKYSNWRYTITILDVFQDGIDLSDPNDCGSFEFTNVRYIKDNKIHEMDSDLLIKYLRNNNFQYVEGGPQSKRIHLTQGRDMV